MPIDLERALGAALPDSTAEWDEDKVILYHLGVGAGTPATDPNELSYTYEANLKVLPSFATIPAMSALAGMFSVDGLEFDPMMLVHGEQEIVLGGPLPVAARLQQAGRLAEIWDKGTGAVAVFETEAKTEDGSTLFTTRGAMFLRGEGGFGGEPGPSPTNIPPEREPDRVLESPTVDRQALLYRLSGDKNPLHADPAFAAMAGFERPILHGLCTYGIVCKAVVDHVLDGDVGGVAGYRARFSKPVLPGQTIVTAVWEEGDQLVLQASAMDTGAVVLSNGAITVRS